MPITSVAADNMLQWVDSVTQVALLSNIGQFGELTEVADDLYTRKVASFGPLTNGARSSTVIYQYSFAGQTTVAWYALLDVDSVVVAIMPHAVGVDSNLPMICMFMDLVTGWIEAPDHALSIGQEIIFQSGPSLYSNTYPTMIVDPINGGTANNGTQNTLPYDITAAYGTFYIWIVAEVETHRFRIKLFDFADEAYVPFYTGWGYYQLITRSTLPEGGTLTIGAIRLSEFG